MNQTEKKCPCKINVMLAITNPRSDGFHDLVSVVCPVDFCDTLRTKIADEDSLVCETQGVPTDYSNLVMKAAELFRQASGLDTHFAFELVKRVPAGAGLGGGSGDGATALLAVNELCGNPLDMRTLAALAAKMGSDCPLFLTQKPVVMRGRGELVSDLSLRAEAVLKSMQLLIFKPDFSINTGAAYRQMREAKTYYIPSDKAEALLRSWEENPSLKNLPLVNNMQIAAFKEHPELEKALESIRQTFKIPAMMSGSGSACFAVINDISHDAEKLSALKTLIKNSLGQTCLIAQAM